MALGDRFSQWVEERTAAWKDRLAGWTVGVVAKGAERLLDDMEPQLLAQAKGQLDSLRALPGLPPETKLLLDSMAQPKSFAWAIPLVSFIISLVTGILAQTSRAALEPARQAAEKATPFHIPDLGLIIDMNLRQKLKSGEWEDLVGRQGWSTDWANRFLDLKHPTMPSEIALQGRLRDPVKYKWAVDNLPKLGLTERDIELLTELSYRIPGVQDVIRYVVKEAYDPATVAEFGQAAEYPQIAEADAAKAGVRPDQLMKEWISHWELPGVSQGYEMMHRGEITPEQLARLLKARDVMPFWRDKLTAISWGLPGRIETRMMALYGLIDKAGIVALLAKDGLAAEYREVVADMNIVRGVKADLQVRYTNGWINPQELQAEIDAQNLKPAIAEQLYKSIVKNSAAKRTATQKDLTVAQIIKGVKKGKISRAEAAVLLTDMGYDTQEAAFILAVEIPEDDTDAAVKQRQLTKADILDGLESGAIQPPEAKTRLVGLRYTPTDADYILKVFQYSVKPPPTQQLKDISKADIVAAVKKGLISPEEGYKLLIKIGYLASAADFILALVPQESPFSPLDFTEFQQLTRSWRQTQGAAPEPEPPQAVELRVLEAQAVLEGRTPVLETQRIQIDTIRRQRRKGLISRQQEIDQLTALKVPAEYVTAVVANDDTRLEPAVR